LPPRQTTRHIVLGACMRAFIWNRVMVIKKILYAFDAINDFLVNILQYFLAAILAVQITLIFMTVVMRYVFNSPLSWSDELATYLLVYITFLGAYIASNTDKLAKVELISNLFKGALGTAMKVLARLFSGALVGWIAFYGTKLFFSPIIQNQTSSAMRIPVKYVWWVLPVTMWLLLISELLGLLHIFVPKKGGAAKSGIPEVEG